MTRARRETWKGHLGSFSSEGRTREGLGKLHAAKALRAAREVILDRYRSPRNKHAVDGATEVSQASASMMTEAITGKKFPEIEDLLLNFRRMMAGEEGLSDDELGDLVALKGVVKYPVRIKCAVLAWDALQEGVELGKS